MRYHLTKLLFTGQQKLIEKLGDTIWDTICDHVTADRFTTADVAKVLETYHGYAPRTARNYASAILVNVRAESGDDVLRKRGLLWEWRM